MTTRPERTWVAGLKAAALFGVTYFAFAEVGLRLRGDAHVAVFWPAAGLAAATFSYTAARYRGFLLAGLTVVIVSDNMIHGVAPLLAFGYAVANGVESLVAGAWLARRLPQRRRIVRLRDVGSLMTAAVIGPIAGTAVMFGILTANSQPQLFESLTLWFAADAVGIALVGPAILAALSLRREPTRRTIPLVLLLGVATAATLFLVDIASRATDRNFAYLVIVPLLVAALWLGQRGTSILVASTAAFMVWWTSTGAGPFLRTGSTLDPVIASQLFMTVVQLTVLCMSVEATRRRDLIAEMQGVLDAAVEAVLVVDEQGTIRRVNRGAESMFGGAPSHLTGEPITRFLDDDDVALGELRLTKGRRSQEEEFWAEVSAGSIAEPSGRRRRALIIRDVSERIATEQRVKRLQDEFVANMTHELRTPLTAIIGYSDHLLTNPGSDSAGEDLQIIKTSAETLQELVTDILDFKKATSEQPQMEWLDLEPIAVESIALMRKAAAQRGIRITAALETCTKVRGDRQQLESAIRNLLSNAIKYSAPGDTVQISITRDEHTVVLAVRDEGIGIADEDQKKLSQRFFRAGNVGSVPGSGLGLAMVREIAGAHAGELKLTSRLGHGTTAELRLPAAAATA
jgi:PAS domain S-box-containing protein